MNPDHYRRTINPSVAGTTRNDLNRWCKAMLAKHPKGKPHKPTVGTVVDRLVDHAKATGFNPTSVQTQ